MSFMIKLFSDITFLNLSVISILSIFNVVVSLVRYNRALNLNQTILIIPNKLLFI